MGEGREDVYERGKFPSVTLLTLFRSLTNSEGIIAGIMGQLEGRQGPTTIREMA